MTDQTIHSPDPNTNTEAPVIGFIVSTTRTGRIGRQLADQIVELARLRSDADLRVIDLAEVALPWLDEPRPPATGDYSHESTRQWARTVAGLDAVVIVLAEYNGGYPAPLKNALDTVYGEWAGTPVLVVSYGGHGGTRSAAALDSVLHTLRTTKVEPSVALTVGREDYGSDGRLTNPCDVVERHRAELEVGFVALHVALGCPVH